MMYYCCSTELYPGRPLTPNICDCHIPVKNSVQKHAECRDDICFGGESVRHMGMRG